MSDTLTPIQYRKPDGNVITIYSTKEHGAYSIDQIFDPDDPQSGTYFPALNSLVVKNDQTIWVVTARDESNYSVTLSPSRLVATAENETTEISYYGNDKFGLYCDFRVNPTKLMVDSKLFFVGNNLVEYALYKNDENNNKICLSEYYDSTGKFISNRIPLSSTTVNNLNIKFPTNCHTTREITDSEPVTMVVFDNLGNETAEVVLYAHDAFILNDLNSQSTAIIDMDIECPQMRGDDIYVYEHQDLEELNIRPYVKYADGTIHYLNVDKSECIIYGLEDFVPSYPGFSQTIIIKYFLNKREGSTAAVEKNGQRFIAIVKRIVVVHRSTSEDKYSLKLSVLPKWNKNTEKWSLRFFAYTQERNHCYDVTDHVSYDSEDYPFDGSYEKWGNEQHLQLNYNLKDVFNTSDDILGTQDLYLTLWDGNNTYARYTYRDSTEEKAPVYGAESALIRKPIIHYDAELDNYFIPSTIFPTWNSVVEAFYIQARPPFDNVSETKAPTPTHFIIRDMNNAQMICGGAIPAEQFSQSWSTIGGVDNLVGSTVVVEFLRETTTTGVYEILYGVPVDVINSNTGYNTEEN